ncbi:aspartic-type endopeptidase [Niveomyces insectorum RCEF 264]|uniref:Probable aspartic-type endopeptidase OPSB n=1 Tax=Niveomyces insectorum RCEF 264 TaxID=1081102 RepID=A0A167N1Z7_9HYPO|nr:aspartic-type endopeptidase [Niveomyces insectorum RCEF 264]
MRNSALAAGAGAALAASVASAAPEGVVQWDIARRQPHPRLLRRADTDLTTIHNDLTQGGYFATCKIGTPSQTLTLQLDTGSSDIWVPSSDASICASSSRASRTGGCSLGSFDQDSSTTFNVIGQDEFSIAYVDGSHANGDYFTDVFTIGGSTVTNMTMGLGQDTDINFGLVGVGYTTDEAIVSSEQTLSAAYNNLPVVMANEGVIKTVAYSLWLNDLDASTGNILFGGIDTDKYHGELTSIDIYQDADTNTFSSFLVALTSLQAISSSGTDSLSSREFPIPVVLDSGTTLSYVPQDLAQQIWTEVGAVYNAEVGLAVIPCSRASSGGLLSFGFGGPGGPTINVTMDELVLDLFQSGGAAFSSGPYRGQQACEFGIQNSSSDPFLLGDSFLRSAYVVYDLVNNQVALAPTDFNATSSNVVAFASSGAPIPSATTAPHQNQVTATPAFTSPAYAASSGFASSSGAPGKKNAGPTNTVPMDLLRVGIVSVTMFLAGGLFVV